MCEVAERPYATGGPNDGIYAAVNFLKTPLRGPVGCPTILTQQLEVGVVKVHDGLWLDLRAAGVEVALLAMLLVIVPIFSKRLIPGAPKVLRAVSLVAGVGLVIVIVISTARQLFVAGMI